MIPCGLVARIRRFHRRGRGSIPRKGEFLLSILEDIGRWQGSESLNLKGRTLKICPVWSSG